MNDKAWLYTDGNSAWKYNTPFENWLSYRADRSEFFKRLYVRYYRMLDKTYYEKGLKLINREIDNFLARGGVMPASRKHITIDMIYSLHRFGSMFDEYFLYEFYNKNTAGREEYICDKYRYDYYRMMNKDDNREIFDNKGKTYELFKEYYKRELLLIESTNQKESFIAFVKAHPEFMYKPFNSSGGRGVDKVKLFEDKIDEFFNRAITDGGFVIEEVIEQDDIMAQFHPKSLNTVRVPTIISDGKITIFAPRFKIGRGNAVVDNTFSGGIFACVDEKTGIVCSKACSGKGETFLKHPDTKVPIIGFQIPEWDKAVELVSNLAHVVEGYRYVGWDLAYTSKGWVMVEGNPRGQFITQMADKVGRKAKLMELINS